ncbi:hypothetical protein HYH03_016711 [Edaphochlamys debaryana]|uniref:Uncharacterized protein n=1 Tax=Edaphochlamys debaryana TaxID=47281 RepID=A0A835XJT7_9CHLO|nr:hypothetical protein HYH03_016711 [Edaphochlamys debaryana]|eukprot:KAG2484477.1 hypothetical protein HYH03_016711 [Edaphochlamys debaryana]
MQPVLRAFAQRSFVVLVLLCAAKRLPTASGRALKPRPATAAGLAVKPQSAAAAATTTATAATAAGQAIQPQPAADGHAFEPRPAASPLADQPKPPAATRHAIQPRPTATGPATAAAPPRFAWSCAPFGPLFAAGSAPTVTPLIENEGYRLISTIDSLSPSSRCLTIDEPSLGVTFASCDPAQPRAESQVLSVAKCGEAGYALAWVASDERELCLTALPSTSSSSSPTSTLGLADCDCDTPEQRIRFTSSAPSSASIQPGLIGPTGPAQLQFTAGGQTWIFSVQTVTVGGGGGGGPSVPELVRAADVAAAAAAGGVAVDFDVRVSPVAQPHVWRYLTDARGACLTAPALADGAAVEFGPCSPGGGGVGLPPSQQLLFAPLSPPGGASSSAPSGRRRRAQAGAGGASPTRFHIRLRAAGPDGTRLCVGVDAPDPGQKLVFRRCSLTPAATPLPGSQQRAVIYRFLLDQSQSLGVVESRPEGYVTLSFAPLSAADVAEVQQHAWASVDATAPPQAGAGIAVTAPFERTENFVFSASAGYDAPPPWPPSAPSPPRTPDVAPGPPVSLSEQSTDFWITANYTLSAIAYAGAKVSKANYPAATLTLYGSAVPILVDYAAPLSYESTGSGDDTVPRVVMAMSYINYNNDEAQYNGGGLLPEPPSGRPRPRPRSTQSRRPPARRVPSALRAELRRGAQRGRPPLLFHERGKAVQDLGVRRAPTTGTAAGRRLQQQGPASAGLHDGRYAMIGAAAFLTRMDPTDRTNVLTSILTNLTAWGCWHGWSLLKGDPRRPNGAIIRTSNPAYVPFLSAVAALSRGTFSSSVSVRIDDVADDQGHVPLDSFVSREADVDLYVIDALDPRYSQPEVRRALWSHLREGRGVFAVVPDRAITKEGLDEMIAEYGSNATNQGIQGTGIVLVPQAQMSSADWDAVQPMGPMRHLQSARALLQTTGARPLPPRPRPLYPAPRPAPGSGSGSNFVVPSTSNLTSTNVQQLVSEALARATTVEITATTVAFLLVSVQAVRASTLTSDPLQVPVLDQLTVNINIRLRGYQEGRTAIPDAQYQYCARLVPNNTGNAPLLRQAFPPGEIATQLNKATCLAALTTGPTAPFTRSSLKLGFGWKAN